MASWGVRPSEPVRHPGLLNKFLLQAIPGQQIEPAKQKLVNPARAPPVLAPRSVSTTQLMMSAVPSQEWWELQKALSGHDQRSASCGEVNRLGERRRERCPAIDLAQHDLA